jgi:hypothetical protein
LSRTLRQKIPAWLIVVVIVLIVVTVIMVTLQAVGIFDFSFLGAWFLGLYLWAGSDVLNGVILLISGALLFGLIGYYIKGYKGTKLPPGQTVPGYAPNPAYPSASSSEDKTVIS